MDDFLEARDSFVMMIKEENADLDRNRRWSLRQHHSGARGGFANEMLQRRWNDFYKGWRRARDFMKVI